MVARSSWKGYLKLSLVAVPVKAYNATSEGTGIHLNQLHAECHNRIRYQKTCPVHGEVTQDEIVSGYEFTEGQYVVVDPEELKLLRSGSDKSIDIDKFIDSKTLDPIYETGRTYYLVPDGPVGQKPYALIHSAMIQQDCHAIAQMVISNREQIVRIRPIGRLLAVTVLNYAANVKATTSFEDELVETTSTDKELDLTRQLVQAMTTDSFDMGAYRDAYGEKLTQLIQAKVEGKELVAAPAAEPQYINLMEALKESVAKAAAQGLPQKPARKMAEGRSTRGAAKKDSGSRKKKSG